LGVLSVFNAAIQDEFVFTLGAGAFAPLYLVPPVAENLDRQPALVVGVRQIVTFTALRASDKK
jgi:hypothetical protein